MQFNQLKTELDKGKIRNLYLFTGPERDVLNKYIKRISPNPIPMKTLSAALPHMQAKGLFATRKTYVIEEDKAVLEMDVATLKKVAGNNTVILLFDTIDKRVSFFKEADSFTVVFERFTEVQLIWFVQKIIDVPDEIAAMIARYCGNDVARVENECHKLAYLGKPVTPEVITDLIKPPLEDRIFDMVDFVVRRQPDEVFKIYYDLLELKESPIKVISLLYTKFKQIFLVQSMHDLDNNSVATKTGLTPFQVSKARESLGLFDVEELLAIVQAIQKAEVAMKTGEMDIELSMEHLFMGILNIGRPSQPKRWPFRYRNQDGKEAETWVTPEEFEGWVQQDGGPIDILTWPDFPINEEDDPPWKQET